MQLGQELYNVQCFWGLIELARYYRRLGSFERALDYYRNVIRLFDTFEYDQLDFHQYALRRQALNTYTRFRIHNHL